MVALCNCIIGKPYYIATEFKDKQYKYIRAGE